MNGEGRIVGDEVHQIARDGPLARRNRVRTIGNGPDLVVFSHGLGTDQSAWDSVIAKLPDTVTALVFDLPGAGPLLPADFQPENYSSIADYADELLALLEELEVRRCTYVGHSVSGMIGVLASIEAPALFKQIVLLNSSPRYLDGPDYVGGFDQAEIDALISSMSDNYQAWVAGFAPQAVRADVPQAIAEFSAGLLAMRPDYTARISKMIFTSDLRHMLGLVTVPTLLIHARDDIAVPEAVAHYLCRNIPGSRLTWIGAVGHMPHLAAPDEVASALVTHLAL